MVLVALLLALAIGGLARQPAAMAAPIVICDVVLPDGTVIVETCVLECKNTHVLGQPGEPAPGTCTLRRLENDDKGLPPDPPDPPEPEEDTQISGANQVQSIENDARFLVPDGIGGGGTIRNDAGTAHFAISATRMTPQNVGDSQPVVLGQVHWTTTSADGSTTALSSVVVNEYGWAENVEGGRWARGTMSVNGEGEVPFVLRAVDGGSPGSSADTIELMVGNAVEGETMSDFSYQAEGTLTSGDLQLLGFTAALPGDSER